MRNIQSLPNLIHRPSRTQALGITLSLRMMRRKLNLILPLDCDNKDISLKKNIYLSLQMIIILKANRIRIRRENIIQSGEFE